MDGQTSATRRQKRPEKTSEGHMNKGSRLCVFPAPILTYLRMQVSFDQVISNDRLHCGGGRVLGARSTPALNDLEATAAERLAVRVNSI